MCNQEDPSWYKRPLITNELISFHNTHAKVPAKNEVNKDAQALIENLRLYLKQNFNLCDRLEFTGSYYEKINICGEVTELDVMFVCRQDLYIEDKKNGLCRVRNGNNMFPYAQDDRGFVDPERYRNFFRGKVARWINDLEGFNKIRLIEHRVASQIDVLKEDGVLWYQVDLVPCFEIGGNLYVPKPINNAKDMWRHSFSLEEREAVSKFTDDTKMVCRIVKALFKLGFNGLLKIYTSYYIKTTAIILCNDGWRPQKSQLGLAVYTFLSAVRGHIESKYLPHQFQKGLNLLDNTRADICIQMANTLANHLRSKDSFLRALKSVD